LIQLGYNVVREAWRDQNHLHTDSEEWYIVLKGKLDVEINREIVSVGPKEILGVKRNVQHRVVGGKGLIEEFSLRVPSVEDKKVIKQ